MSQDAEDRRSLNSLPQLPSLYATYGVQVNALTVEEIFALYERTGFLYPETRASRRPHLELVRDNWRRMLSAGESLLMVLGQEDLRRARAAPPVWRTAPHGWMPQH